MDGRRFRDLVAGRSRGIGATGLRCLLAGLEIPYTIVTGLRNAAYDRGLRQVHQVSVPVVSVGNLTLGGTGKSPMVAWLARWFLEQKLRPGLISRGYGSSTDAVNDEYLELAFRLPEVPHVQNRDRVVAAKELLAENPVDVLILDDAFQHRRIHRDLDILLLDALEPFGFDHVFPRGTLRESLTGLRRANIALLSRADLITGEERADIRRRAMKINPKLIWGEVVHRPKSLLSVSRNESNLEEIRGVCALSFCGIGNPEAFQKTLEFLGVQVAERVPFPDHYRYTQTDLERLEARAKRLNVDVVLCTMKDLVKINHFPSTDRPIRAVSINLEFLDGEDAVRESLSTLDGRSES